uniref:uncharacterized protein LOC120332811 isoform X2 n=1 Tax=Styela clava TaxID=7725 RepID=UPI0019393AB4|nr:uncharacterized protein LOC120332811 isoform X2 [Styela clava]
MPTIMCRTERNSYDEDGGEKGEEVNSEELKKKKKKKEYKLCNWIRGAFLISLASTNSLQFLHGKKRKTKKTIKDNKYEGLPMMTADRTYSFENLPGAVFDEKELVVSKIQGKARLRRPKTAPANRREPSIRHFPPVAFWTPVNIKQGEIYQINRKLPDLKLHMQSCIEARKVQGRRLKPLKVPHTSRYKNLGDKARTMRPKTAPSARERKPYLPPVSFWTSFDIQRKDIDKINHDLPNLQECAEARPKSRRSKRKRKARKTTSGEEQNIEDGVKATLANLVDQVVMMEEIISDVSEVMNSMLDEITQGEDIRDILESPVDF